MKSVPPSSLSRLPRSKCGCWTAPLRLFKPPAVSTVMPNGPRPRRTIFLRLVRSFVNNMLGYAKNLEMLHVNLTGLTVRLMAHNPGRTAAQVQQLDDWPRTVGFLLASIIIFFPQDVIDAVS